MNDFASRCAIAVVAATLAACGRNDGDPGWGCGCDAVSDQAVITPDTAGVVLFKAYQAYRLAVGSELREHLPRDYLAGTRPACKTGSQDVDFSDNDHSGDLSTGDAIVVTFAQCTYDSVNGLGEVFIDGQLDFTDFEITSTLDRWIVRTGLPSVDPLTYRANGIEQIGFGYNAERSREPAHSLARSYRANGGGFGGVVGGKGISLGGAAEERRDDDSDSFTQTFALSTQDGGYLQHTDNPVGLVWSARTTTTTDPFDPNPVSTPLSGRASENDGYPSAGTFQVDGVSDNTSYRRAIARLTAQGTGGSVKVETLIDDGTGSGAMVLQSTEQTTWQALAASASR